MIWKSKREQNPRTQQFPTLEELLRNGERVLYGQVCWSIANRGTERPTIGDIITLEGGESDGVHTNEDIPPYPQEHR